MTTRNLFSFTIVSLLAVILSIFLVMSGCDGGGGCPWTSHGKVLVTPPEACLNLSVAGADGQAPSTGCVNPVLFGYNNCDVSLTLPGSMSVDSKDKVVKSGAAFTFEVSLNTCKQNGEDFHARIPATLGKNGIVIEFDLYAP